MAAKSYFPEVWSNDLQMAGLMSMVKLRDVNPVDYDRKITFWTDLIGKSCLAEKDCVISLEKLKKRFRRGDQIPGSLDVVLADMHKKGEILTVGEVRSKDQGWLQWGYSLMRSSLWSSQANISNVEYVHLPTAQAQARQILEFYQTEYVPEDDMPLEIVEYDEFKDACKHIVEDETSFHYALTELVRKGELTIGSSKTGEQILKFRDASVRGPIQWTESDASVHDMRRAMSKLEREIRRLEEKAKKAEQDARISLRSGDRNKAAHHLRAKKRALREVEAKDNQYQRLLEMIHQLGQTKQNKNILDAYKAGVDAFKSTLERQGVNPDQIDETLDSVSEAMSMANDIRDAISSGVPSDQNEELEAELESILNDNEYKQGDTEKFDIRLPSVPTDEISAKASGADREEVLFQRLKKLREVAQ
uniref:Charged multivesicular body protein 7 n=1 Tax=Syphacia muris TaxID=451379 RepID=A0A0N5ATD7_9BILA